MRIRLVLKNIFGKPVGDQVALMHAAATALPVKLDGGFRDFDDVRTVQTFRHIPGFETAVFPEPHLELIQA